MKKTLAFLLLFGLCQLQPSVMACSAFLLKGEGYQCIGFNENGPPVLGLVIENKRGIQKSSLSWANLIAEKPGAPELQWTSKYGSLTFNALGIDLPFYGINERGLFVVELALDNTFSPPGNSRPRMFWAHWIQYQLDSHATVDEVVAHLPESPVIDWWPEYSGSQFFIADQAGHTAAISLINGKFVVWTGDKMPVPALCNSTYSSHLESLKDPAIASTASAWDRRFPLIASRLKDFQPATMPASDYAWKLVDDAVAGTWQLVIDVRSQVVSFRTGPSHEIKTIRLADLDFGPQSPVRYIDVDTKLPGDVGGRLAKWTPEINLKYFTAGIPGAYNKPDFYASPAFTNAQKNILNYGKNVNSQIHEAAHG